MNRILESLGWRNRIWRIWSTDWFRNPLAETDRLVQFLEELKRQPTPDDHVVPDEPVHTPPPPPAKADLFSEDVAGDLVFEDEDDDLEIGIGDLVTYAPSDALESAMRVRLTARNTNPDLGLVAASTPLGSVLLGPTVGETVVLRVPGKGPQSFVIQAIKRASEETVQ